ncbi:hypothetical protein [Effusibacillus lacus]|uniref:Uncharacterized protein n=1 Tax=Effusibacillus lacus TaxID=1348429 RepID=A0A292YQC5_9BACL|nr:hypothetical protein [Effusibacillus lacus]TCS76100.1 hypothetical protein EDD64_10472 [Effusibacillus lacus]GAX91386.1 hypothetical protein EFBL_3055 [Effusibacillus lacus]
MKWGAILGVTLIAGLMALYEWPKIGQNQKREKVVFVTLTAMGWVLAVLLVFFPDIPGPTQLIDAIFKPLGQILEK